VSGREMMYEFCAAHDVPFNRCGKLIVASEESEVPALVALKARGDANGVAGLEIVDRAFVSRREPAVAGVRALYSPETGVVDAEHYVKALLRVGEGAGVIFLPGTRLLGADIVADGIVIRTERETIHARQVVNAAGLYADEVSMLLGGERFTIYPCRGEYVELAPAKRSLVNGLVYPLPGHVGLGVHVVKTMGGPVWLGPTAEYQDSKDDYEGNRLPVEAFLEASRRLLTGITLDDLRLSGSGIRPKLQGPQDDFVDFMIRRDGNNPHVVQASGIDSPGLTSSLAIGSLVSAIVDEGAR
jgi:glycerol-3-phosphate dehydrogenase